MSWLARLKNYGTLKPTRQNRRNPFAGFAGTLRPFLKIQGYDPSGKRPGPLKTSTAKPLKNEPRSWSMTVACLAPRPTLASEGMTCDPDRHCWPYIG